MNVSATIPLFGLLSPGFVLPGKDAAAEPLRQPQSRREAGADRDRSNLPHQNELQAKQAASKVVSVTVELAPSRQALRNQSQEHIFPAIKPLTYSRKGHPVYEAYPKGSFIDMKA